VCFTYGDSIFVIGHRGSHVCEDRTWTSLGVVVMEIIVVVVTSFFSIPLGNGISYGVPVFFHSSWERNKSFIALASDDVFD
jgi:hypothetical protein